MIGGDPEFSVSEFVAALNQTLEYAFGSVVIYGELANFKVSRNRWVYFSLKDEQASIEFFGSVYALPGPLEDGMLLKIRGVPRLHERYGFSVIFSSITPTGSGSIKRASNLLAAKLEAEGLFAPERKRSLPYPPSYVGLITSLQSAAYSDFKRVVNNRWGGLRVDCYDVSVQGDQAPAEITRAIDYFAALAAPPEVLVLIRGGGSPEDLAAFSSEQVTRAVAGSRIPTMVAIGHERDISLAELAADSRASTPSNAAEILVPDKKAVSAQLKVLPEQLAAVIRRKINESRKMLIGSAELMPQLVQAKIDSQSRILKDRKHLITALSPLDILKRGYSVVRFAGSVSDGRGLKAGSIVEIEMYRAAFEASINKKLGAKANGK